MSRNIYYTIVLAIVLLSGCESASEPTQAELVELGIAQGCDAATQPCLLSVGELKMTLTLEKNIRTLKPFHLRLELGGSAAATIERVSVEFFMEGMDMGLNRYRLLARDGGWDGEITLPVCVATRSDWRAVVEAHSSGKVYRGDFQFHSSK